MLLNDKYYKIYIHEPQYKFTTSQFSYSCEIGYIEIIEFYFLTKKNNIIVSRQTIFKEQYTIASITFMLQMCGSVRNTSRLLVDNTACSRVLCFHSAGIWKWKLNESIVWARGQLCSVAWLLTALLTRHMDTLRYSTQRAPTNRPVGLLTTYAYISCQIFGVRGKEN